MLKKHWLIKLDDKEYDLEVIPSTWFRRIEVLLDGVPIKPKENYLTKKGSLFRFNINENDIVVFVKEKGWENFEYDLYINNCSIETGHEFSSRKDLERIKYNFTDFVLEFFKVSTCGTFAEYVRDKFSRNLFHTNNSTVKFLIALVCFAFSYYLLNLIIEKLRTQN